jgi:hypothetical protein
MNVCAGEGQQQSNRPTDRVKKCFFSVTSRPAVGSTKPPIQWLPDTVSPEVIRRVREADYSSPSSSEINDGAIPPLPYTS